MSSCKAIISIVLMTVFINSMAANLPHGCEVTGFSYKDNYLIVNQTGNQSFYLIQNRSNTLVTLERFETQEVFMSPPLTAKLDPTSWAAFASDVENLHFKCVIKEDDNDKQIDCGEVLEVCQYPRVKFALSNMGNYWVSMNKAQDQVINESASKGILLRW
ncbi:MAG: enhanced entry protein EnhB [Tatlockia sp.]|nr:enhanced entry protein EnhB [Tatlockia sp.]